MIWSILILSLGLVSAKERVEPEYLSALRESGNHEEFAKLLGVDVSLVREDTEKRSEDPRFNHVSPLGDILLPADEDERQVINFAKWGGSKWPNNQIPLSFQRSDFSNDEYNLIINACAGWNEKVHNLKLVYYNGQQDYVQVMKGNGCWSYLGKIGGQQPLSLGNGCVWRGTVQHELMHAAGFAHEQNRNDRDNYLRILWHNIPQDWHSQYEKVNDEDYRNVGNYGYNSIMHYGMSAPGTGKDAFELPPGVDRNNIGNNEMTDNDARRIDTVYTR